MVLALLVTALVGTAEAQTPVRVATWNIERVGAPGSTEYDAALAVLDRIGAEVVAINEIASNADVGYFLQLAMDAGYFHVLHATRGGPFGAQRNGFLMVSEYPILSSTQHTAASLSGDPEANDISRDILEVTIDVPGDALDLTLVVDHWKSGTANSDEFRRAIESRRISQALDGRDSATEAYVVLGDVNEEHDSVPRSPAYFTELPTGLPASFSLGSDLSLEMMGLGIENNPFHYIEVTAQAQVLDALQKDGLDGTRPASGRRLDYIFVSSALRPGALAEVYDSADEDLPGGLPKYGSPLPATTSTDASDHFMVFADLVVPASGSEPPTNTAPTAAITSPAGGTHVDEGTAVSFSGTAQDLEDGDLAASLTWSSDLDGPLGQGSSLNAVLTVGAHVITASVTDSGGLSDADTIVVTVDPQPVVQEAHVGGIAMSTSTRGKRTSATARVTVLDSSGAPVSGASVSGSWSGVVSGSKSVTTDGNGVASFTSSKVRGGGTYTFTVNSVTKSGWTYDSSANEETSDSITR
jgi:endonuclease/exonuclease/phosphatase family metal-dependent hydrolase